VLNEIESRLTQADVPMGYLAVGNTSTNEIERKEFDEKEEIKRECRINGSPRFGYHYRRSTPIPDPCGNIKIKPSSSCQPIPWQQENRVIPVQIQPNVSQPPANNQGPSIEVIPERELDSQQVSERQPEIENNNRKRCCC